MLLSGPCSTSPASSTDRAGTKTRPAARARTKNESCSRLGTATCSNGSPRAGGTNWALGDDTPLGSGSLMTGVSTIRAGQALHSLGGRQVITSDLLNTGWRVYGVDVNQRGSFGRNAISPLVGNGEWATRLGAMSSWRWMTTTCSGGGWGRGSTWCRDMTGKTGSSGRLCSAARAMSSAAARGWSISGRIACSNGFRSWANIASGRITSIAVARNFTPPRFGRRVARHRAATRYLGRRPNCWRGPASRLGPQRRSRRVAGVRPAGRRSTCRRGHLAGDLPVAHIIVLGCADHVQRPERRDRPPARSTFDSYFGQYCRGEPGSSCDEGPGCCEAMPRSIPGAATCTMLDAASDGHAPDETAACVSAKMNGGAMVPTPLHPGVEEIRSISPARAPAARRAQSPAITSSLTRARSQPALPDDHRRRRVQRRPEPHLPLEGRVWHRRRHGGWLRSAVVPARAGGRAIRSVRRRSPGRHEALRPVAASIPRSHWTTFRGISELERDIALEQLPAIAVVLAPPGRDEQPGRGPAADGIALVTGLVDKLTASPRYRPTTLVLVTYLTSGGYYDHVPPPAAPPIWSTPPRPVCRAVRSACPDAGARSFCARRPCVAHTARGFVDGGVHRVELAGWRRRTARASGCRGRQPGHPSGQPRTGARVP